MREATRLSCFMQCRIVVLSAALCAFACGLQASTEGPAILAVAVEGARFPVPLEITGGQLFDTALIDGEVRRLYATGRFDDIRVESIDQPGGVNLVFRFQEKPRLYLRRVLMEADNPGLKIRLEPSSPMDEASARQVAAALATSMREGGFRSARVEARLIPITTREVDLSVRVESGPQSRVQEVALTGDLQLDPSELKKTLHATRIKTRLPGIPGLWDGWRSHPVYTEKGVQSDVAHLKSLYLSRGFFDAEIRLNEVNLEGKDATVHFLVDAGSRYDIRQIGVAGVEAQALPGAGPAGEFHSRNLCSSLLDLRRKAEQRGVLDFGARLNVATVGSPAGFPDTKEADLTTVIEHGRSYVAGRIEFWGNKSYSDAALHRMMLFDEGEPLDPLLLRKSIARLNRSGLFAPLEEDRVAITRREDGSADVTVALQEIPRGRWNLSGPMGPLSFAGPLRFDISSRLPSWGRGLFEASTYFVSFTLLGYAQPFAKLLSIAPGNRFLPIFFKGAVSSSGESDSEFLHLSVDMYRRWGVLFLSARRSRQRVS